MKKLQITFILLIIAAGCTPKLPKAAKGQEAYLLKELIEQGIYLGMPLKDLRKVRPNLKKVNKDEAFRLVFEDDNFGGRIDKAVYYTLPNEEQQVYEFILIMKPEYNNKTVANAQFGTPNHQGEEWRFLPTKTGLPFTVAAWTFQNKVIMVGTLKGSEWEKGVD